MKKIPCSYEKCNLRRPHYLLQEEERSPQLIEVEDDYEGEVYCSLTCMILAGKMSVKNGEKNDERA